MHTYNRINWAIFQSFRWYVQHAPISRGKGFLQRYIMKHMLPTETTFTVYRAGITLSLYTDSTLGNYTLFQGPFEQNEISYLCHYLKKGDIFMDIGANVGIYTTLIAKKIGPTGTVFALEPEPRAFTLLTQNIKQNNLSQVKTFRAAAADQPGTATFITPRDNAFTTRAKKGIEGTAITVNTTSIDTLWNIHDHLPVRAIKIDVEGDELHVLHGARKLIDMCRPIILIEANNAQQHAMITHFLKEYNYITTQPPGFSAWNYLFIQNL